MKIVSTRRLLAPPDVVWATQLDHAHWPERLPNFSSVERRDVGAPFGLGSSAAITQPGLGTVEWTVTEFEDGVDRKCFAWKGSARGATYVGRHEVVRESADASRLTLTIEAEGTLMRLFGFALRRSLQKTIDAESVAFEAWVASLSTS